MTDYIKKIIAEVNKKVDLSEFKKAFRSLCGVFDERETKLIAELRKHSIADYKHYQLCRVCDGRWKHDAPEEHADACLLKGTKP